MKQSLNSDLDLNSDTLATVFDMADPAGVLSLYAGLERSGQRSSRENLRVDLDIQLFRAIACATSPLANQLHSFRPQIQRFVDEMAPGRGRALFCGVETGQLLSVFASSPFDSLLMLRPRAFVLPLLCAIKSRDLTGVVALTGDRATVIEGQSGSCETMAEYGLEQCFADWTIRGAQLSKSDAGLIGQTVSQVDSGNETYQRGHWHRIALDIHDLGQRRGWGALVVSGDPRFTETLEHQLKILGSRNVLTTDKSWSDPGRVDIGKYGLELAAEARVQREAAVVVELLYQAVPQGQAVCGLDSTMKAMVGHAVSTLVFSSDSCREIGWRFNEGLEQMVELAAQNGTEVLPVTGEASIELSRCDGFAARLRRPYRPRPRPAATPTAYAAQLQSIA